MNQLELVRQSVALDWRLLTASRLSRGWRARYIARKYGTLLQLRHGTADFDLEPLSITIRNVSGLGTLQSSIVDFYHDIVASGVLGTRPLIIDVGANIGQFANAAKLFFPRAQVVSFEPDPDTFGDLKKNTAQLSDVQLHNVGLGAHAETRTFYRHVLSAMSSFSEESCGPQDRRGVAELDVVRLDDMIGSELRPDLVKIDAEGFEAEVLAGAWETLRRSQYLLVELSLGRAGGSRNLAVLRDIVEHIPSASVMRFGRPLGREAVPICQDVLIALMPRQDEDCQRLRHP
jgi:FkbM family methyltransferase